MTHQQSTSEVLERVDQVTFEVLADAVLYFENPDCTAIMHFGINSKQKSIKSPVDGFCEVPGSNPPRYIFVQHTTTNKKSLRGKWLRERVKRKANNKQKNKIEKGDLIKAGNLVKDLRKCVPNAVCTVILTNNYRPDIALCTAVSVKAKQLGLFVDIWEQTRIVRFLDNKPAGNWLRWKHFGIAAERLSEQLLEELCKRSFNKYRDSFPSLSNSWVARNVETTLDNILADSNCSLLLLASESGHGKSVLCARLFQRQLNAGVFCFWTCADIVQRCASLNDVLIQTIQALEPALWPNMKDILPDIIASRKLILIVDDVNRTPDPSTLVRKLSAWLRPRESTSNKSQHAPAIQALCPVWPSLIDQFALEAQSSSWVRIVLLGLMSETEAVAAVETGALIAQRPLSPLDCRSVSNELGRDSYLIGLWTNIIQAKPASPIVNLARNVQEESLENYFAGLTTVNPNMTSMDFREALLALGINMLHKRNLSPVIADVWYWFGEQNNIRHSLAYLLNDGRMIRLNSQHQIIFRHDRLRDLLLQMSLPCAIKNDGSLISDPFFARYFGAAVSDNSLSVDLLPVLQDQNPLSLFEAIAHIQPPSTPQHGKIYQQAIDWIKKEVASDRALPNVVWQVSGLLYRTDSPAVLTLTEDMPSNRYVLAARLRNGCTQSGAILCGQRQGWFQPSINDFFLESTLTHSLQFHRPKVIQEVCEYLKDASQSCWLLKGNIIMAGFIGEPVLLPLIVAAWRTSSDKTRLLPSAIWACLCCATDEGFQHFQELLVYWNGFSLTEDKHGRSEMSYIAEELYGSFRRINVLAGIKWLKKAVEENSPAGKLLGHLMIEIDDPEAIEFIIKTEAKDFINSQSQSENYFSLTSMRFRRFDPRQTGGRGLSLESQAKLLSIWNNCQEDIFSRKLAFRIWALSSKKDCLSLLQSIPPNDSLYDSTIWKRAELGDKSIASVVATKISESPNWCWVAHLIWGLDIKNAIESLLKEQIGKVDKAFSESAPFALDCITRLLTRISTTDAENILEQFWNDFGKTSDFVICALAVGTSKCRSLAAQSISACPRTINILRFVFMKVAPTVGEDNNHVLEHRLLESLVPHLDRLCPEDIKGIGLEQEYRKHYEWIKKHLYDRLSPEDRARLFPNDADMANELTELEKQEYLLNEWLEELTSRQIPMERIWPILEQWFMSNPTLIRQNILFNIIEAAGTRCELPLLERASMAINTPGGSRPIANERFAVCLRTLV